MGKTVKFPREREFKHSSTFYRNVRKCLNNNFKPVKVVKQQKNIAATVVRSFPLHSKVNITQDSAHAKYTGDTSYVVDDQPDKPKQSLQNDLHDWALEKNVNQTAMDSLLGILRNHGHQELPRRSKTLLSTPQMIDLKDLAGGQYWHNGLCRSLKQILLRFKINTLPSTLTLILNVDGVRTSKSSKAECWPILYRIKECPEILPHVIGIFFGEKKPSNCEEFLREFVDEAKDVMENGLQIHDITIPVSIQCFVCDSPARALMKGVVYYNHGHGCIMCTCIGEFTSRMSFPNVTAPLRTDEGFRRRDDPDHHRERTPLEELNIDMIKSFPVSDVLHLIDLGITKRLLIGWVQGSFNFKTKWSSRQINYVSVFLEEANKTRPAELHRSIRGLNYLSNWKGLEFRTFILYTGMVVLKDVLPEDVYEHFLQLSCAIIICSREEYLKYIDIADVLLKDFVEKCKDIYGRDSIVSNFHNLSHLINDVKNHGILSDFSTYPFESALGNIKNLIRSGKKPLVQIAKRLTELSEKSNNFETERQTKFPILKRKNVDSDNFTELHIEKNFKLTSGIRDKWFLTNNNNIVEFHHAESISGEIFVKGSSVDNKIDFFDRPFKSSRLNIYQTITPSKNAPQLFKLEEIKCKLFSVPYKSGFVYLPILHTINK